MKKICIKAALFFLAATTATAQEAQLRPDNWYFGVGGGFHSTFMNYSDLDENIFPTQKNRNSGVFSIFLQGEFGKEHRFAVRPELNFLQRGGKLTDIYSNSGRVEDEEFIPFYEEEGLQDVRYSLKARYLDLRVPLIYQFGKASSTFRPYVFVAPVLGFSLGGGIDFESRTFLWDEEGETTLGDENYYRDGIHLDLSKSNMSSFYFAAAVGAGVKWQFNVGRHTCFLGLEAQYEHGFTDTYGDDNEAKNKVLLDGLGRRVEGTRKFSGVEVKLNLGIPFSVFKKQPAPAPVPVVVAPQPEPVAVEEPVVEEKPCYSLEEINDLMARGERVEGKTICAIDDAINFEFGKSNINPRSYAYLDRLAATLSRTNARIMVKGHTDNVGSEEFNLNLSKERAMAVVDYLVKKGVSRAKLAYDYYGMSRPLMSNDTEEGRSMNRRVEFEIMK